MREDATVDRLGRHWRESLEAWAIPEDILRRAPESPWGFPSELFRRSAAAAVDDVGVSPSRKRALEALAGGGTVLDVGVGAGAASLPLAPPAAEIVAVDESPDMLELFAAAARARGVAHSVVNGRWPDVAAEVGRCDVVVCHHVVYNVAELVPFLDELDRHARRRVVVELTEAHPQSELNPLWRDLHGVVRPETPTAADVVRLLRAMGAEVGEERFTRPALWTGSDRAARVAFARKRLCVGPERDPEVERLLPEDGRRLVTLWWVPVAIR